MSVVRTNDLVSAYEAIYEIFEGSWVPPDKLIQEDMDEIPLPPKEERIQINDAYQFVVRTPKDIVFDKLDLFMINQGESCFGPFDIRAGNSGNYLLINGYDIAAFNRTYRDAAGELSYGITIVGTIGDDPTSNGYGPTTIGESGRPSLKTTFAVKEVNDTQVYSLEKSQASQEEVQENEVVVIGDLGRRSDFNKGGCAFRTKGINGQIINTHNHTMRFGIESAQGYGAGADNAFGYLGGLGFLPNAYAKRSVLRTLPEGFKGPSKSQLANHLKGNGPYIYARFYNSAAFSSHSKC